MRQLSKLLGLRNHAQGGKKMKLYENGAYLIHGKDVVINGPEAVAEDRKSTRLNSSH